LFLPIFGLKVAQNQYSILNPIATGNVTMSTNEFETAAVKKNRKFALCKTLTYFQEKQTNFEQLLGNLKYFKSKFLKFLDGKLLNRLLFLYKNLSAR